MKKILGFILASSILNNNIFFTDKENQQISDFSCNFEGTNNNLIDIDKDHLNALEKQAEKIAEKFNFSKTSTNNCLKQLLKQSKTNHYDLTNNYWKATKYDDDITTYSNSTNLEIEFNNINLRNNQKALINLKPILNDLRRIEEINDGNSYSNDYTFHITNMYNYLSKFYGKENVSKWVFNLNYVNIPSNDNSFGLPPCSFWINEKLGYSNLVFSNKFAKSLNSIEPYWNSTSKPPHTFIHEYGHVLDFSLQYKPLELNTRILPNKYSKNIYPEISIPDEDIKEGLLKSWNDSINNETINNEINANYYLKKIMKKPSELILDFLKEKYINNINKNIDDEIIKIIYYLMSHSRYGIEDGYGNIFNINYHEIFSEAFSYWMISPTYNKTLSVKWNLLNQFFTQYLPNHYNNLIK